MIMMMMMKRGMGFLRSVCLVMASRGSSKMIGGSWVILAVINRKSIIEQIEMLRRMLKRKTMLMWSLQDLISHREHMKNKKPKLRKRLKMQLE
jgi:hypothetical protein